jgi:glutaredoxin
MNKKSIFVLIAILLIIGTIIVVLVRSFNKPAVISTKYDDFAKCLSTKKLTMYGAVWCSHCKSQKELFGDSFQYVPYVECTENAKECLAKGIQGYPTWLDEKETKYIGEQSLKKLSEISSCVLPAN